MALVRALAEEFDQQQGPLDFRRACEEGVGECEACGEVELAAQMHYYAARHAMSSIPPNLESAATWSQVHVIG